MEKKKTRPTRVLRQKVALEPRLVEKKIKVPSDYKKTMEIR
jgi:hypothetical protein